MGLIGKIALISVVAIAIIIAVIWDLHNEGRQENGEITNAAEIKETLPENITTEITPTPESPQQTPPEQPQQPEEPGQKTPQPVPVIGPGMPETPGEKPNDVPKEPGQKKPEIPPAGQKYVIQKHDSFSKIAEEFYGDKKLWRRLAAANADIAPDPEVLVVGTEIIIPPKEQLLVAGPAPDASDVPETYIVQKGDTLSSIARMHYNGDTSKWKLIYEANNDRIPKKDVLTPGTVLVIPPLPKEPK